MKEGSVAIWHEIIGHINPLFSLSTKKKKQQRFGPRVTEWLYGIFAKLLCYQGILSKKHINKYELGGREKVTQLDEIWSY